MKQVFSSNSEVCHVWAQQTQFAGRAGSIFFRDSVIYSYGEHFPMARVHKYKGKRVCLITSRSYSATTSRHKSHVRDAVRGLMNCFVASDIDDIKSAVKIADDRAKGACECALKRLKVYSKDSIRWQMDTIREAFEDANLVREFVGLKPKSIKPAIKAQILAHLEKRLIRYQQLNTPEMIEKRKREASRREIAAQKANEVKQQEQIELFRAGKVSNVWGLKFEMLRIDNKHGEFVTSRGARVPLEDAKRLYHALKSEGHHKIIGQSIGSYIVNAVWPVVNPGWIDDKQVHIGCHKILLSEAAKVLGAA